MNRDSWIALPPDVWGQRLRAARELACQRLASAGLNLDIDNTVAGLILEDDCGEQLLPALGALQDDVNACVSILHDPVVDVPDNYRGEDAHTHLSEYVFDYAMAVAEAAFLFGVISGTHVPWSVVERVSAPTAPPTHRKRARSTPNRRKAR